MNSYMLGYSMRKLLRDTRGFLRSLLQVLRSPLRGLLRTLLEPKQITRLKGVLRCKPCKSCEPLEVAQAASQAPDNRAGSAPVGLKQPKLSILMPTNRTSLSTRARILEAASMASDDVEVIIRDNSGDADKAAFLAGIKVDNCRILFESANSDTINVVSGARNMITLLDAARGKFALFFHDDDWLNREALPRILSKIDEAGDDPAIAGVAGTVILQRCHGDADAVLAPQGVDAPQTLDRMMSAVHNNMVHHYAMRSELFREAMKFVCGIPYPFLVCWDWDYSMMLASKGRFLFIDGLFYDRPAPEDEAYIARRLSSMYRTTGVSDEIVSLFILFAVFEMCAMVRSPKFFPGLAADEREAFLSLWWKKMRRETGQFDSYSHLPALLPPDQRPSRQVEERALALIAKWGKRKAVDVDELLTDLCDYMALSNPAVAAQYRDFWTKA